MKRTQILKVNHLSKNGVIIVDDMDTVLPNVDKNNKIIRINLKSTKNQKSHSINTRKEIKTYQTRIYTVIIALEKHFQATQIIQEINHHITPVIEVDRPNKEIHEISHKTDIVDPIVKITNIEITIRDRIQKQHNLFLHPVPNQTQGIDTIPTIDHEIHHITEIGTIQALGIEVIQIVEIRTIQTTDQGIVHTIDKTIKDQMITNKTDHKIIHKTETQATTIDTETIPSHPIRIIAVTPILNIDIEVTNQTIKDKSIRYKQMKKQLQTPQVLITQKTTNYK